MASTRRRSTGASAQRNKGSRSVERRFVKSGFLEMATLFFLKGAMDINFLNLRSYFRDDEQRQAVQEIVRSRLADDRNQEECRYLMRFWWQLCMTNREVTLEELERFVSPEKFGIILELLNALEVGHKEVDTCVERYIRELLVVEDRGFEYYKKSDYG